MKRNIRTILRLIVIVALLPSLMMVTKSQTTFAASSDLQAFVNMTEEQRAQVAKNMTQNEKEIIMNEFSKQNATVNENMNETKMTNDTMTLMGNFVDAGDGFHKAEGIAKVINLADGRTFLRLENLKTTNGPDLYVNLSVGKDALDIVNLGRLKGNIGNQNYEIPAGTDLSKYNTALIWCKAFSTLFGSAKLSS
ncbi:MAG: DM13 domain-containing protein [Nitrososphaeraceae archaeon]|nr:DM13 domain-containing protein [Nitrososphaeraceae archaeon]MDW0201664.1 DM13 domain-containing protein [Nitrososphaeraceae archaeon]MDW0219548.1 DM13 domain-containing protein [Nitrososphaeraceae archaeon]MDW0284355.1 DM13 domain-containing protein [Nitrososphaeraceae archaeon]MDW3677971.1 DM13 domain-containing protein [Nitrososphaeraceae archaeon]